MPEHEDITGVGNLHESKATLYDSSGGTIISADGSELYLLEQAAAAADRSGYAQVWAKSDTPCALYFTDDAGTDFKVALENSSGVLQLDSGVRQTFAPDATNAGINVGSVAGDPSTPSNGDLWYDSTANELTARINGANVALGAGGGGGASTALDNLSAVAINTSLISDTDATDDLGSSSIAWKRLYLQAGVATDIPVNIELASAQTANALNITSNGGSAGDLFRVTKDGYIAVGNSAAYNTPCIFGATDTDTGIAIDNNNRIMFITAGNEWCALNGNSASEFVLGSGASLRWDSSTIGLGGTRDTGLDRASAGVVKVTNGSTGDGKLLVGGTTFIGKTSSTAAPTTTEIPTDHQWAIHEDTTGPTFYIAINDGGTIRSVALS